MVAKHLSDALAAELWLGWIVADPAVLALEPAVAAVELVVDGDVMLRASRDTERGEGCS